MKYMQKIKKVIELFEWFCQNIIWLVMLCCVGFVAVLNLLYRSKVAYVWTEDVSIERNTLYCIYCNLYNCRDILDCECFNGIAHGCVQCT